MKPAWRTVYTVLALSLVLLAALYLCRSSGELGAKMFTDAVYGLLGLGGVQGLKSGVQHAADAWKAAKTPAPAEPAK